jgi:hypothetical protein
MPIPVAVPSTAPSRPRRSADANINSRRDVVQVGDIGLQSSVDQDVSTVQSLTMQVEKRHPHGAAHAQDTEVRHFGFRGFWWGSSPRPHQPVAATRQLIEKIGGDLIHAAVDCKVGRSEELYGG